MTTQKLKIGLFIDTFFPMVDGVIMVVDNYARRLNKFADVTVFAPYGRDKTFDDSTLPYKVVRCKMIKLTSLDYDLPIPAFDGDFRKALSEANLDIVHIHSPFSLGREGVAYAKRKKIPVVATMHSQFKQDFYAATKSKVITNSLLSNIMGVFNSCTECWTVNEESSNIFVEYGAKVKPKVQQNGTDMFYLEDESQVLEIRKKHNVKDNEKILMFVGRINKIKNIFFIVDALKILKEKNFKFKMMFIGSGQDEEELKEYIISNGLQEQVIMVGKVTDRELMTAYYRSTDLFLFPSFYDTNGLVQIEAASQKTPTIFIKGSAASSTAQEGVNGFKSENTQEDFACEIIKAFFDPEVYNTICEGAYRDIYLPWDKAVGKAYKDYLQLITDYKILRIQKLKKIAEKRVLRKKEKALQQAKILEKRIEKQTKQIEKKLHKKF